jgi:hypothetical protein
MALRLASQRLIALVKGRCSMFRLFFLAAVGCAAASVTARATTPTTTSPTTGGSVLIDFEDLLLAPESYYNGRDGVGGFTSQGTRFRNTYDSTANDWLGWALSNGTDSHSPGFGNQYSAFPGGGVGGSGNFGVGFTHGVTLPGTNTDPDDTRITLPTGLEPVSMQVTNTTYAALSMLHGDVFAKRFGGPTGNDPDYFRLRVMGYDAADELKGSIEFYLADYRFADSQDDYLVSDWRAVDLSGLRGRGVRSLSFNLESSDTGFFGVNTPAYFALDDLLLSPPQSVDPLLPGDANGDGAVSRDDVLSLALSLGQSSAASWRSGDFDRDHAVTLADLAALQSHFGTGAPIVGAGPNAVPEPACLTLAIAGVLAAWMVHRRRGR